MFEKGNKILIIWGRHLDRNAMHICSCVEVEVILKLNYVHKIFV